MTPTTNLTDRQLRALYALYLACVKKAEHKRNERKAA